MKKTMMWTVLALNLLSSAAWAGGMTSSGGDMKDLGWESAWFLGSVPISYCVEIAPSEKLTLERAKSDFESVVAIWKAYYFERYAYPRDPIFHLDFNFAYEPCQESTRLKIYVGVSNPAVEEGKKLYQKPYAFSERQDYDYVTGRGHGFIWFAPKGFGDPNQGFPDWSQPYNFHGMLLHEMGHVFGCGHAPNTIMAEDLISYLETASSNDPNWAAYGKMYMTQIDNHHFLLLKSDSELHMIGRVHPEMTGQRAAQIFEKLAGRTSRGEIRARLDKISEGFVVTYKDDVGPVSFTMPINHLNRSEFSLGTVVFRMALHNEAQSTGSSGFSYVTELQAASGEKFLAMVDLNSNGTGWPITARFMDDGKLDYIFMSDLWLNAGLPR